MDIHFPPIDEPASPEYILAVLRDELRQSAQEGSVDLELDLQFQTTIATWRTGSDLLDWRQVGHAYNQTFGINCPDSEWRSVLEPARTRTVLGSVN
jgi:hypothetical protein